MSTQTVQIDVLQFLMPRDRVRHPKPYEEIPRSLDAGFEQLGKLDTEWAWVLESQGEIKGIILACPCHGTAFIWRVAVMPGLENTAIVRLLRGFLGDMRKRGVKGLLTIIDPKVRQQSRLKRVLERIKGKGFGTYELVVAPMPGRFV